MNQCIIGENSEALKLVVHRHRNLVTKTIKTRKLVGMNQCIIVGNSDAQRAVGYKHHCIAI